MCQIHIYKSYIKLTKIKKLPSHESRRNSKSEKSDNITQGFLGKTCPSFHARRRKLHVECQQHNIDPVRD